MTLVATTELLTRARAGGYGVPAFNVIGLEHAEAIVRGAEDEQAPVILQLSQNAVKYHFDLIEPIGTACRALAEVASVPVALHLDHATTEDLCERAVRLGFSSVMFDAALATYDDNVQRVGEITRRMHSLGADVEGVIGIVGGKDGITTEEEERTDPAMAREYVERTGVDSLAVAVGTRHAMESQDARIDLVLIDTLRQDVPVPLVLHGSSGVPDADLAAAVKRGMTKVNIATHLNKAFTTSLSRQASVGLPTDPRRYLGPARDAVLVAVRDRLRLLGTAGRA